MLLIKVTWWELKLCLVKISSKCTLVQCNGERILIYLQTHESQWNGWERKTLFSASLTLLYSKIIPASLCPIYEMWCRVDSIMKFYDANTFSSQAEAPNTPQEFVGGSRLWGMWAQTTISSASCLISTLGNSANTDLIRQAKVCSYPQNKQTNIFLL